TSTHVTHRHAPRHTQRHTPTQHRCIQHIVHTPTSTQQDEGVGIFAPAMMRLSGRARPSVSNAHSSDLSTRAAAGVGASAANTSSSVGPSHANLNKNKGPDQTAEKIYTYIYISIILWNQ